MKRMLILLPLIICSCKYTIINGVVETYNGVELNNFPMHISYRPENYEGNSGRDLKVRRDNSFLTIVNQKNLVDLTIDVSPEYPIWEYSQLGNIFISPKAIYANFESFKKSNNCINMNTIYLYDEIVITDYMEDCHNLNNLKITWTENIPDVDFYTIFFKSLDNKKSFSIIGINGSSLQPSKHNFIKYNSNAYHHIIRNVKENLVMVSENSIDEGEYSIKISAYRINDDESDFFNIGSSGDYYPGKYIIHLGNFTISENP